MVLYNITRLQSITSVVDLTKYANDMSNGIFSSLLMVAIFLILTFALKRYDFAKAITVSSFICFMLSILLSFAGLLYSFFIFFFLFVAALGMLYNHSVEQ